MERGPLRVGDGSAGGLLGLLLGLLLLPERGLLLLPKRGLLLLPIRGLLLLPKRGLQQLLPPSRGLLPAPDCVVSRKGVRCPARARTARDALPRQATTDANEGCIVNVSPQLGALGALGLLSLA